MNAIPVVAAYLPVHVPLDFSTNMQILLRWVHLLAGITWIGLGYFFVLAGSPWQAQLSAAIRQQAVPGLLRRALWWFRWSSVAAVLAGLWLWMMEVGIDRRAAGESGATAIGSYFALWTLAYLVYMSILMIPSETLHRGPVLALLTAILICVTAYAYLRLNAHGWETNRMLAIGIGGGIGWFMMFNVWGIVWRCQKRLVLWTEQGSMPSEAARMARLSSLAAKTNAWLSLPMLFFMAVASHYPLLGLLS